jgi:hypothetical protein
MFRRSQVQTAVHVANNNRLTINGARRLLAALALLAWWSGSSYAIEIVAIEEHWELSVGEPDESSSAPQVTMVMSHTGHLDGNYFVFTLNHRTEPEYQAGGMQVQLWTGEDLVYSRNSIHETPLSQTDETITWVQRTELVDGTLAFEVSNGHSDSWGTFGNQGRLRLTLDTTLENLNDYRPATSLQESGISFAGNRVRSLTLTKLRWIDSEGHVYELNAPIDVDADLDP